MNSIKATARRAGALYFLFLIVGLVDMFGFSHFLVPGDATATARNIVAAESTYRIGILTDFVTLLLFIFLVVSLYNLLKGVDKWHVMLMVVDVHRVACVRARCVSGHDAAWSWRVPDNLLASNQGGKGAATTGAAFAIELKGHAK